MTPQPQTDTSIEFSSSILQLIPARKGKATLLRKGQYARIINTHGGQVVDTWALALHSSSSNNAPKIEYMSMSHTRARLDKVIPCVDDTLVTNHRRPILTLVEDTSTGKMHDTLIAACDIFRYRQLGCAEDEYHENCSDNFHEALKEIGPELELAAGFVNFTPDPLNVFMNIPICGDLSISWQPSACEKDQYVTFRAEMDLLLVMSACPQDIVPINGMSPRECHFLVST